MSITPKSRPQAFQDQTIKILVLGCGENGSAFVRNAIARVEMALDALSHQGGIKVILADGADVSEKNMLRSTYCPQDIGFNKSYLLSSLMDLMGLKTEFTPLQENLTAKDTISFCEKDSIDFVVVAVDDNELTKEIIKENNDNALSPQLFLSGRDDKDNCFRIVYGILNQIIRNYVCLK